MKAVGNGWENLLTVTAPAFCGRERERERERRTGKRNRYYRISETEHIDRECNDYDRESVTQIGNTNIYNHSETFSSSQYSNYA
jgi:hypothetical protein